MPQFKNQLFPRRAARKLAPALTHQAIYKARATNQPATQQQPAHSASRGQPITRAHERLVIYFIGKGYNRSQIARQIGISRTSVSLLAAGKYPFGAHA